MPKFLLKAQLESAKTLTSNHFLKLKIPTRTCLDIAYLGKNVIKLQMPKVA